MPINFDLEKIRKENNCCNYFETGLWDPESDISCKKALSCGFDNIFCIEIREDWVEKGKKIFSEDISKNRCHLILDDSTNMISYMNNIVFDEKTLFFLDAHVDNSNIKNYKFRCPLFHELNAIKSLKRKDNIILIDDIRLLKQPFPWGETAYGKIDFVKEIKNHILQINENYKFDYLNGCVENDVLIAYI
jgi:hypothetical protein